MKKLLLAVCCSLSFPAFADLKLPAPSPGAKVMQTAGLTDITIDYSAPAVKGRKIWGGLVPYDQVWRSGANKATNITFSQPVVIDGKDVPAGTYSFFTIPGQKTWTLVLNKNAEQWGGFNYDQSTDLLRMTVTPQAVPMRERLAYAVTNFTNDAANIDLEWEKLRVTLPVKLKTAEQAEKNIVQADGAAWQPMNNAARYYLEVKDWAKGLAAVDKSIATKETWLNVWVKAQLLAGSGKVKDAYPLAEKAQTLGAAVPPAEFFYSEDVKKALKEWKGK